MKRYTLAGCTLALAMSLHTAEAAPTACPQHFPGGVAPDFTNTKLAAKARPLCFREFAVMHSGVARTPLWSAEHLTAAQLEEAKQMKRENSFHEETRLPPDERAELADYARSGFDRGHMAPSGDMPDRLAQHESFSLANIVPQDRRHNQQLWSALEETVRKMVRQRGELYVITGPLFEGASLQRLRGRVLVPTAIYKAVVDPRTGEAGAWLADNHAEATAIRLTLAELEQRAGIRLFPTLSEQARQAGMPLPLPKVRARKQR